MYERPITYNDYKTKFHGSTIPTPKDFDAVIDKATLLVNEYTENSEKFPEQKVLFAICAAADVAYKEQEYLNRMHNGIKSESVGDWSVTYDLDPEMGSFYQSLYRNKIEFYLGWGAKFRGVGRYVE